MFENKYFYISGIANKKSVAYFVAKDLEEKGARLILSAQNETNLKNIIKLFPNSAAFILDVEDKNLKENLYKEMKTLNIKISGFLHSIAFANFSRGPVPFHETLREDFMQAAQISSFSLVEMSNALKDFFEEDASVVAVSISNTLATSYGYLGPIKAMLETSISYLAKSFSEFSKVRFNSVKAGPLKTSASSGIPDYIENYLFAEELTMRKDALKTEEVANTISFLLSKKSSGINASHVVIDGGMSSNYFDQKVVKAFAKNKF